MNPYKVLLKGENGKKIVHTNLIFYHLPILCSLAASFMAGLDCCEWLIVVLFLFSGLIIYPISFIIRKSKIVSRLRTEHVKKEDIKRISSSLLSGFLDLIHIIYAIIMTICFLTILLYYFEQGVNGSIYNLNEAISFSLSALDVKGTETVVLNSTGGMVISVILWGISQVLLAMIIGFWINSFKHIFVSFED